MIKPSPALMYWSLMAVNSACRQTVTFQPPVQSNTAQCTAHNTTIPRLSDVPAAGNTTCLPKPAAQELSTSWSPASSPSHTQDKVITYVWDEHQVSLATEIPPTALFSQHVLHVDHHQQVQWRKQHVKPERPLSCPQTDRQVLYAA